MMINHDKSDVNLKNQDNHEKPLEFGVVACFQTNPVKYVQTLRGSKLTTHGFTMFLSLAFTTIPIWGQFDPFQTGTTTVMAAEAPKRIPARSRPCPHGKDVTALLTWRYPAGC